MPLTAAATATLRAVLDRLIPRDDFPGATDAGVDVAIARQLDGDCAAEMPMIAVGLAAVEAEANATHGAAFAALSAEQQDELLEMISRDGVNTPWSCAPSLFFNRLVELAAEGFYADPGQGGNRDEVSWRMVGYARRIPDRPIAP